MNEPTNNGPPAANAKDGFCSDNVVHFVWGDNDPDATEEVWPNCGPSLSANPPKTDAVRETLGEELRALMNAMTAYKRKRGLEYLLWEDVLDVLHDMGYRKVALPAEVSAPARETTDP